MKTLQTLNVGFLAIVIMVMPALMLSCDDERVSTSAQPAPSEPAGPLARAMQAKTATAQSSTASRADAPFQGTFHTSFQGSQSILKLDQSGQQVSGKIDLAILSGTVEGNTARGDVKNPETNQVGGTFVMTRKGNDIEFQLTLKDPETGQTLALPAFSYKPGEPQAPAGDIDPQLVGRWRYTYTYTSGDFTAATDTWLILNADGSYEYGYTKGGAGGTAGSIVGGGSDPTTGKWRAQNQNLMYQESGDAAWHTFARYYVEGNTMMLTFADGEKKLWYRH